MLMVVLGAGASYDSLPDYVPGSSSFEDERLPLANQLFENREAFARSLDAYPQCKPIVPYLRSDTDSKSIEKRLQYLLTEAQDYPVRNIQISAIRYYLRDIITKCEDKWLQRASGITNHLTLLDQIERRRKVDEQVCIVTFNYDRIMERALATMGIEIHHLDEYIRNKTYKLIKLHGSVNWVRIANIINLSRRDERITTSEVINQFDKIEIRPEYYMLDSDFKLSLNYTSIPAIAIPIENKSEFECPPEHVKVLSDMIPLVDKILLIGWRATEKPFLELLGKNLTQEVGVWAVADNKKNALETTKNLTGSIVNGSFNTSNYGFTDFIIKRDIDKLLLS